MSHTLNGILLLALTLSSTACLKTRAQMKEEEDQQSGVGAMPVEQPHGNYAIDELKSEITRLSGKVEELERRQAESGDTKDLEKRMVELEQSQLAILEAMKKSPSAPSSKDPSDLFFESKKRFNAGQFKTASQGLQEYLESSHTRYAAEATYLLGDSYFSMKEYKKAIIEYAKFSENKFGKSPYIPKALYMTALSFEALGMKDDSRAFFQELINSYPKSKEAKQARKKIK